MSLTAVSSSPRSCAALASSSGPALPAAAAAASIANAANAELIRLELRSRMLI
jgi:hypothetical protein